MPDHSIRIQAPSRLHFGLLGWGPDAPRQFGGVGLMVDRPGLDLVARRSADWHAEGPLAARALEIARHVAGRLAMAGANVSPISITIRSAPPEHVGLGTGTQLSLSVARAMAELAGSGPMAAPDLAALTGRGRRSGVGLHGFDRGGLLVDGGHGRAAAIPPLIARMTIPTDWKILLVIPTLPAGLHGRDEVEAFRTLEPVAAALTDRLCRLVLLELLPAVAEDDLPAFGEALGELQRHVGRLFAPAQRGDLFAHPMLAEIAGILRAAGLHGVGQSSWGPTLYAFWKGPVERFEPMADVLVDRFDIQRDAFIWTRVSSRGARVTREPSI